MSDYGILPSLCLVGLFFLPSFTHPVGVPVLVVSSSLNLHLDKRIWPIMSEFYNWLFVYCNLGLVLSSSDEYFSLLSLAGAKQ